MKSFKPLVLTAAWIVFGICVYAFLLGSKVFEGQFSSDPIAWYFLAKGIFCSLSLCISVRMLEVLSRLK